MKVKEQVVAILAASDALDMDAGTVDITQDLERYGLNSMGWVKLLMTMEKTFHIRFEDAYILSSKSNTIQGLTAYIEEALNRE